MQLCKALAARLALGMAVTLGGAVDVLAQDQNGNWTEYNGDHRAWRYSPLDEINLSNIAKLKVAWIHQPGDIAQGLQATPLVSEGVLYYIAANNRVYAIDGKTGAQIWEFIPELEPDHIKSTFAVFNRGVALANGKVIFGSSDGRLIAVDQASGKEAWQVQLTNPKEGHGCNFNAPPTIAGNIAILGKTGGDLAQRGQIYGVDVTSGKLIWTFDVLKDDPSSWTPEAIKIGGGGAWMPGQYDPKTGLYYVGTSNPAPDYYGASRPGDNLYTSSIVAIEPKSGKLVWHHQEVPHDVWDYDSQNEIVSLEHGGNDVMFHLNKGGFVTVLNKKDGKVINVWQFAENVTWVDKVDPKTGGLINRNEPTTTETKIICPAIVGARSLNAGAYSPKTKLWYTNGYELCAKVKAADNDPSKLAFSQLHLGVSEISFTAPPGKSADAFLKAFDPLTGKLAWRVDYKNPALGFVLATAGNLVFNGDSEGYVHAYDATTGKEVWKLQTGSGIRGGIVSYKAGGKQYIVVPSGFGGIFPAHTSSVWTDFKNMRGGAALIAFTVE